MSTQDEQDDARAALAEWIDRSPFNTFTGLLIDRCRPLLEPSEADTTLAKIRDLAERYTTALAERQNGDVAAARFVQSVMLVIEPPAPPPPRPIEIGDPVKWTGDERRWTEENPDMGPCPAWEEAVVNDVTRVVLAVNYDGSTLDITDSKANFINVPVHQCTRKEGS